MKNCLNTLMKLLLISSLLQSGLSQTVKAQCSGVSAQDSLALVALYNATNGSNWNYFVSTYFDVVSHTHLFTPNFGNSWLNGPISTWHGVVLTDDGCRVKEILMESNGLNGTIPPEIGDLDSLNTLVLRVMSQLSGFLPPEIGSLSNLNTLNISSTGVNGTIPLELANLSNLMHLYCYKNQLSGSIPAEFGDFDNLRTLSLSTNQLSGEIPSELGNLDSLTTLHLQDNQLSGTIPSELGNCSNLLVLLLQDNQLSGCIPSTLQALCSNINTGDISNNPNLATEDWNAFCSNGEGVCNSVEGCYEAYQYKDSTNAWSYVDSSYLDEANQVLYTVGNTITAIDITTGNVLWAKSFGYGYFHNITQAPNGDLLIVGRGGSVGSFYYKLLRFDSNGTLIWQKNYKQNNGNLLFNSHIVRSNGDNYFLVGRNVSSDWTVRNLGVIKIDSSGNELWNKELELDNNVNELSGVCRTSTGGVVITGLELGWSISFIIELDANGIVEDIMRYEHSSMSLDIQNIIPTLDGGYAMTLRSYNYSVTPYIRQMNLVKLEHDLSLEWVSIFDTVEAYSSSLVQDNQGNFYISTSKDYQPLFIKCDSIGNYIWSKSFLNEATGNLLGGSGRQLYYTTSEELLWTGRIGNEFAWGHDFTWGLTDTSFNHCFVTDVPLVTSQGSLDTIATTVTETVPNILIEDTVTTSIDYTSLEVEGLCEVSCSTCPYALRSVDLECASVGDTVCVWLDAVVPVDAGITGLNYCLEYDPTLLSPTGNTSFGNVVGVGSSAQITLNTNLPGYVLTTTNYLDNSTFQTIAGEVVCIEFVLQSTLTGSSVFNACELREAKGAILEDECVDSGILTTQAGVNYADLEFVFAHDPDSLIDNGNPIPGANTVFHFMDATYLDTLLVDLSTSNGHYLDNIGTATHLKLDRDIEPDNYYSNTCQVDMWSSGALSNLDVLMLATVNNFDAISPVAQVLFPSSGVPTVAQMIAMDVNRNGRLDGDDVTQLQRRIVGDICEFQQADNYDFTTLPYVPETPYEESYDWVFIDSSWLSTPDYMVHSNYPNFPFAAIDTSGYWRDSVPVPNQRLALCPSGDCCGDTLNYQLQGILVGDANGSWNSSTNFKDQGTNYLLFDMNEVEHLGSDTYRIPVHYEAAEMIYGIDFVMDYDETKIQIEEVVVADGGSGLIMTYNDFNGEELRLTSFSTAGITTTEPVLFVEVTLLEEASTLSLTDLGPIEGGILTLDGAATEIVGITVGVSDSQRNASTIHLTPNPTTGIIHLNLEGLTTEYTGVMTLSLRNLQGQLVYQNTINQTKSTQLNVANLTDGVYILTVTLENGERWHEKVVKH